MLHVRISDCMLASLNECTLPSQFTLATTRLSSGVQPARTSHLALPFLEYMNAHVHILFTWYVVHVEANLMFLYMVGDARYQRGAVGLSDLGHTLREALGGLAQGLRRHPRHIRHRARRRS